MITTMELKGVKYSYCTTEIGADSITLRRCRSKKDDWIEKWNNTYLHDSTTKATVFAKTIAVSCASGIGIARCHPKDVFNIKTGCAIAYARARGVKIPHYVVE